VKAVVLAGGSGSRLGLSDLPKPMVSIDGVPLLERTVRGAVSSGITDFLFMTGYRAEAISDYFGGARALGATITHVIESEPLGTAGCFNQIRDLLTEPFLVIYGDVLMDVDLRRFADHALGRGGAGTLFVHPNDHPFDSDLVETDADGRILAIHPKPHSSSSHHPNLVSAALYVLSPAALEHVPRSGASDWARDIFPSLAQQAPLHAYRSVEYVKDIGTPARLASAVGDLRSGRVDRLSLRRSKPALFLDRDGVIVDELDGLRSPDEVRLVPGAAETISRFNRMGVPVICVTNQPGLAKGQIEPSHLRAVTGEIDCRLAETAGAYLDDIFICPHHPERGWPGEVDALKIDCDCRKPKPGLLVEAAHRHNLDLGRSWLIGDRYRDVAAARAAGAKAILVGTGHNGNDRANFDVEPDLRCQNIGDAADALTVELA
jgi:mannose-1-phosphate guanylyltransferase/phosphomannomutase